LVSEPGYEPEAMDIWRNKNNNNNEKKKILPSPVSLCIQKHMIEDPLCQHCFWCF
jgi:hypothetical protein